MASEPPIRLQLGASAEHFAEFWNDLESEGVLRAEFREGAQPVGGFGSAIASEVLMWMVQGAATTAGAGTVTFLWTQLRAFFRQQPPEAVPSQAAIAVGSRTVAFDPRNMPPEPPPDILEG
jgi:hypothetical protein